MDIARGAAIGATIGGGFAIAMRMMSTFASSDAGIDERIECDHLRKIPMLRDCISRFQPLRASSEASEKLYGEFVSLADTFASFASIRESGVSQFKCNRICSEFQHKCKELCAESGRNREFAMLARQLMADEMPTLKKMCDDHLHNMILSS